MTDTTNYNDACTIWFNCWVISIYEIEVLIDISDITLSTFNIANVSSKYVANLADNHLTLAIHMR